jgi:hypothetical protein
VGQAEQLPGGLVRWKNRFVLGHFPELAIIGFNPVVGLDQPPNFGREVKEGG